MILYVNKTSKKIYNLVMSSNSVPTTTGIPPVAVSNVFLIERLFDFKPFQLTEEAFTENYRKLTQVEMDKFDRIAPRMHERRVQVTLDDINNVQLSDSPEPTREHTTPDTEEGGVGRLVTPGDLDTLDRLIVQDEVKTAIMTGIELINNRDVIDDMWGISELNPLKGRCIMNMVGPPGTGKTLSAKCIAKHLGLKLYQVDYAEIISKYVGETGKNIRAAFASAKKHKAILFFDEADSLMSKRIAMAGDGETNSINQNRNILMQELDKYDGIMLTSTNFFGNYDEALLRRISRHIHFELPNAEMRKKLVVQHLPKKTMARLGEDVNFETLTQAMTDFSGGDIVNVCNNAILRAVTEKKEKLEQSHLMSEISEIKKNKKSHGSKASLKKMGF
jgi:AAA+ superfamily predicted ATPase